jgi:hypothetical protein
MATTACALVARAGADVSDGRPSLLTVSATEQRKIELKDGIGPAVKR